MDGTTRPIDRIRMWLGPNHYMLFGGMFDSDHIPRETYPGPARPEQGVEKNPPVKLDEPPAEIPEIRTI